MKHLLLVTLVCVAFSTVAVGPLHSAPKSRTAGTPTIIVSPSPYTPGALFSVSGSNFTAMDLTYVDVDGPSSFSLSVYADRRGNFSISNIAGLPLTQGSYVVTAHQPLGVSATTGLEVQ